MARCLTDFSWVVYIADLLVAKTVQRQGIGAQLLMEVQRVTGPRVQQLLLLSGTDSIKLLPASKALAL
ncbi:GNAT family N-acetyltransferase [Alishewanella longhuensis]